MAERRPYPGRRFRVQLPLARSKYAAQKPGSRRTAQGFWLHSSDRLGILEVPHQRETGFTQSDWRLSRVLKLWRGSGIRPERLPRALCGLLRRYARFPIMVAWPCPRLEVFEGV